MRTFKHFCAVMIVALLTAVQSNAQKTMDGMQLLTVNENITTVITASEPVRLWTSVPTRLLVTNRSTIPFA